MHANVKLTWTPLRILAAGGAWVAIWLATLSAGYAAIDLWSALGSLLAILILVARIGSEDKQL